MTPRPHLLDDCWCGQSHHDVRGDGDDPRVRPSDSRAESQAELTGPSGSLNPSPRRATGMEQDEFNSRVEAGEDPYGIVADERARLTSGPHEHAERMKAQPLLDHIAALRGMADCAEPVGVSGRQIVCSDVAMRSWADALEVPAAALLAALSELDQAREAHEQLREWAQAHADKLQREWDDDYGPEEGEPAPWQTTYYKPLYDALAALAGSAANKD